MIFRTAVTEAEPKSEFKLTAHTPISPLQVNYTVSFNEDLE